MKPHAVALLWLRRDLRLADNPALTQALEQARQVVVVYVHSPDEDAPWIPGAASNWWLHHSLTQLQTSLQQRGNSLCIRSGNCLENLLALTTETGATLVCWNRLYEPACIARDTHIKQRLQAQGLTVSSHNAALWFEPWEIRTQSGTPYKVFTPFWRNCLTRLQQLPLPLPVPDRIPTPALPVSSTLDSLNLLPRIHWDEGLAAHWQPGESGALSRLERFTEHIAGYAQSRDRPDLAATSALSPHLHFGEMGPRQIHAQLQPVLHRASSAAGAESYLRELGWREFGHHLLYHFPHTTDAPLDPRFNDFPWVRDATALQAWQRGLTGVPLVDAGMRELWHTGWMHNRVRMIVASFLTKNLRIDWRAGARWFWDTLVDADLANNTAGWQWVAGSGADAAPYFRVFNPVLQSERFDPTRTYIRHWCPELARLPDRYVHQPWTAPVAELERAGVVLGRDYPLPIVDLPASRDAALAAYATIKGS